ncbi:MAG: S8 family serine peptidase [Acidobacteriota bacterium]|nr:MAG: S8 family serine peptidase [Acidobacteriota bacterium]
MSIWKKYQIAPQLCWALAAASLSAVHLGAQTLDRSLPTLPQFTIERTRGDSNIEPLDKLSPELYALYEQFSFSRRSGAGIDESSEYTSFQLESFFGIDSSESDPLVVTSISFAKAVDKLVLEKARASVIAQMGNVVYVMLPIRSVGGLVESPSITRIGILKAFQTPSPLDTSREFNIVPRERSGSSQTTNAPLASDFDKQLLSGRGVLIGIIDTGIDWKHSDFRKSDGTSRIHTIWDLTDDSFQTSQGRIGSKPPIYIEDRKRWLGTVYTNKQINDALLGKATVNSFDLSGHGTAVAGTAASNGRATSQGIPLGTYSGVASDSELIIVKVSNCGEFLPGAAITAGWIIETARSVGKPVAVNLSFGTRFTARDGSDESEHFLDSITGPSIKGAIVTTAAGNDSRMNIRAGGRFAPKRRGQADQFSNAIELNVSSPNRLMAIFDRMDDWGIAFRSTNPIFQDTNGKQATIFLVKNNRRIETYASAELRNRTAAESFFSSIRPSFENALGKPDTVQFQFPAGNYIMWGFGTTPNVTNGRFDLYIVESAGAGASFGTGTLKTEMLTSPGNAKNAITVGSYDFRDRWINLDGETTFYNLSIGAPSYYSNPGFRRDGLVKPDIVGPGRFAISSLSQSANPNASGCKNSIVAENRASTTRDGFHIAWEGTSASTPFVTGVIALMLQKNPNLDSEQVRSILKKTARSGGTVGAVPNPIWGWGMLDPGAALRATPAPNRRTPRPRSR